MPDRDPPRLSETGPNELARMLDAARLRGPSPEEINRLHASLDSAGAELDGALGTDAGPTSSLTSVLALKAAAVGVCVAALGGVAGVWMSSTSKTSAPASTPAPRMPPESTERTKQPGDSVAEPNTALGEPTSEDQATSGPRTTDSVRSRKLRRRRPGSAALPSERIAEPTVPESSESPSETREDNSEPADELTLLKRAQDALPRDPRRALALAHLHAERFPDGTLAQERKVLAIEALWALGQRETARKSAAQFFSAHPSSAHRPRLERLLR